MTIQISQRIGRALNVRSATRLRELDTALREMIRSVGPAATTPLTGSIDASQVGSGTFDDARVAQSNVTQHEAALNIDWMQLDNVPSSFTPAAHTHAPADVTFAATLRVLGRISGGGGAGEELTAANLATILAAIAQTWTGKHIFSPAAANILDFDSSDANGPYVRWQRGGTSFADMGSAAQVFSGGTNDGLGLGTRGATPLELGANGARNIRIGGGASLGFNGTAPLAKPTVTGSRGGNAALASLLTELANYGLITDSSTA